MDYFLKLNYFFKLIFLKQEKNEEPDEQKKNSK
jgi:hypothetical protein